MPTPNHGFERIISTAAVPYPARTHSICFVKPAIDSREAVGRIHPSRRTGPVCLNATKSTAAATEVMASTRGRRPCRRGTWSPETGERSSDWAANASAIISATSAVREPDAHAPINDRENPPSIRRSHVRRRPSINARQPQLQSTADMPKALASTIVALARWNSAQPGFKNVMSPNSW